MTCHNTYTRHGNCEKQNVNYTEYVPTISASDLGGNVGAAASSSHGSASSATTTSAVVGRIVSVVGTISSSTATVVGSSVVVVGSSVVVVVGSRVVGGFGIVVVSSSGSNGGRVWIAGTSTLPGRPIPGLLRGGGVFIEPPLVGRSTPGSAGALPAPRPVLGVARDCPGRSGKPGRSTGSTMTGMAAKS